MEAGKCVNGWQGLVSADFVLVVSANSANGIANKLLTTLMYRKVQLGTKVGKTGN